MKMEYNNKLIANVSSTKFLEMVIRNSLPWKIRIEETIPKLSVSFRAVRSVKP